MTTIVDLKRAKVKYYSLIQRVRDAISTLNPVEVVTPTNVAEEKKKWIERVHVGIFTNPYFRYNVPLLEKTISRRERLIGLSSELSSIVAEGEAEQFVLDQLKQVVRDGIDTTILAESILFGCDDESAEITLRKYGLPAEEDVHLALNYALSNLHFDEFEQKVDSGMCPYSTEDIELLSTKCFNAEGIRDMFDWAMLQYGKCWPIEINPDCTSIDVRDKSVAGHPVIVIPVKREVSGLKLAELIGHEIECHWRSSVNASLIGVLKSDDELVYEGLAALKDKEYNRNYCGTFNLNSAYYMIAMNEAMQSKCFARVGGIIHDHLPISLGQSRAAKAWLYTYRVFRGITDTENASGYAFTKDRAYFEGYRFAKQLLADGKADYLAFSTLNKSALERLMSILSIDDIRNSVMLDKDIQAASLQQML